MADATIQAGVLKRAAALYLQAAYPKGTPAAVTERVIPITALADEEAVPTALLEAMGTPERRSWALRLGQPKYPHMKLVVEQAPDGQGVLLRADAHDMHLHAPAGSPDAAWLAGLRAGNKDLTEKIEAAWVAAGLPTFREFLRRQVAKRRGG